MCRSVNVYVGGCCVRRLSASDGEGSIGQLQDELSRSLDPLVLEAKLEEEGCEAPALLDEAETEDAPATFLALLCSFGMLARGAAIHVETSACMAGWPAGAAQAVELAEVGPSLGQPAACSQAESSLRSASWPKAEPACVPHRQQCSIASRWRRSGIALRSPPSPDHGPCTFWARTTHRSVEKAQTY